MNSKLVNKILEVEENIKQGDFDSVDFQDYYEGSLIPKVVKFNTICFGDFTELSNEEKAKAINFQINIVNEEMVNEFRQFFGSDNPVEELDAIADTLFTLSYLHYQLGVVNDLPEEDYDIVNGLLNHAKLELLVMDSDSFFNVYMRHFDAPIIIEASELVIANNNQKFTDNPLEFEKWQSPKGENLVASSREYDGVTYYVLVNENGKVRKKKGFKGVQLKPLVEKQGERFDNLMSGELIDDRDVNETEE